VPEGESLWYSLGCAVDTNNYILTGYSEKNIRTLTIDSCLSMCEDKGFTFGGVEFGEECYCGNSIPTQITYNENQCDKQCTGDSSEICGGGWGLELFELVDASQCEEDGTTNTLTTGGLIATGGSSSTGSFFESSVVVTPTAVKPTTTGRVSSTLIPTTAKTVATTAASVVTISSSASPSVKPSPSASISQVAAQPSSVPPSSSNDHVVWAHYMVGNTYPYQIADWNTDISKAQSYGIDGFALNLGSESWQLARAADGYQAAKDLGQGFKMFLSLDMTAMSCSSWSDAAQLVSLVRTYATHPNQAMHNGKVLVSTFAGEYCTFGTGSNNGWQVAFVDVLKAQGVNIFFVPSLFSDISTFSSNTWMDGELNWNSAWPMGKDPLTTAGDNSYMNALGSKEYMPAISPFFYTHFGANSWNKNWLYRGDDWLYATRWEQIISMREKVKMMEILTWNDYGESSYIGPIHGALPANSGEWVYGYDHEAINTLTKYYATAFKTGSYPAIEKDQVIMWARPHSRDARASNDDAGQPTGWDRTEDNLYAVILSTQPSMVTLRSGSTSQTFNVGKGLTKLKIPMAPGAIGGEIVRNGQPVASYSSSGFDYTTTPQKYNFNYYLGSSS
jgi:glucan endo-1,3-alpha-glucosidase